MTGLDYHISKRVEGLLEPTLKAYLTEYEWHRLTTVAWDGFAIRMSPTVHTPVEDGVILAEITIVDAHYEFWHTRVNGLQFVLDEPLARCEIRVVRYEPAWLAGE